MHTDYVSQWKPDIKEEPLTRQSFLDMLDGKIPTIKEPQFVSREVAQKLEDAFSSQLKPYLHSTGPTLLRAGVAQFEFQALSEADLQNRTDDMMERYFLEAEKNRHLRKTMEEISGHNPWQAVIDRLQSILPDFDVGVAEEGPGKKYFSGILRAINDSTPIHCDWSPYDNRTEDWIIKHVTKQGVFNLYLTSFTGGRTELHDVQWTPDAVRFRDPESYGYSAAIIEGRAKGVLQPQVGDLYLFNSRNMHQVFPVEREEDQSQENLVDGRRQRLTLSSFFGVLPAKNAGEKPKLILWS